MDDDYYLRQEQLKQSFATNAVEEVPGGRCGCIYNSCARGMREIYLLETSACLSKFNHQYANILLERKTVIF